MAAMISRDSCRGSIHGRDKQLTAKQTFTYTHTLSTHLHTQHLPARHTTDCAPLEPESERKTDSPPGGTHEPAGLRGSAAGLAVYCKRPPCFVATSTGSWVGLGRAGQELHLQSSWEHRVHEEPAVISHVLNDGTTERRRITAPHGAERKRWRLTSARPAEQGHPAGRWPAPTAWRPLPPRRPANQTFRSDHILCVNMRESCNLCGGGEERCGAAGCVTLARVKPFVHTISGFGRQYPHNRWPSRLQPLCFGTITTYSTQSEG